jgi:hypothetical protein
MSIRYYPSFRVKTNLRTEGSDFLLNGKPYRGFYYQTFDSRFYSGKNPATGKNERLTPISTYENAPGINDYVAPYSAVEKFASSTGVKRLTAVQPNKTEPVSYYPTPTEQDYKKGSIVRYFVKRINDQGYVKEISQEEYASIKNGTATYDVSFYQIAELFWKLTGPINTVRLSQYDIRAGIVDTNKRLTENLDKTFLGIKAFIGEEYAKFSRVTQ